MMRLRSFCQSTVLALALAGGLGACAAAASASGWPDLGSAGADPALVAQLAPSSSETQGRYDRALEAAGIEPHATRPSGKRPFAVCPAPSLERSSCLAVAVPGNVARQRKSSLAGPRLEGSGELGGYSPADLHSAYNLPEAGGSGMVVAITIAYDYPTAEADLAKYRETYGLPPCTGASSCFEKVNQEGKAENYPEPSSEWSAEAALDLDMVSAMCPECKLRLVEANNDLVATLPLAVDTAAALGANVISDSWGGGEFSEETSLDVHLHHPGIPILFASGDAGYGAQFPASSREVIAAGGTSLHKDQSARGWRETAWAGAGSGCSAFEKKPAWQTDTGCTKRTVADISAIADPETPVSIYDTYGPYEGWELFGGTSVASPLLAGVEAHYAAAQRSKGAALFWKEGPEGKLYDVTEGRNGPCRPEPEYLCTATLGYGGPTGWGTPGASGRPAPPVVGTYFATSVNESEAALNGAINPNGEETTYHFEYGSTTAYGKSVPQPDASAGPGTNAVEVSAHTIGLKPDTTYHYRLLASNGRGSTYGGDRTFVTSPWAVQYMPRKRPQREEMLGVSCAAASFCMSVGQQGVYFEPPTPAYNNAPLVERWEGNEWVRDPVPVYHPPNNGFASSLEGVSCSSPSSCMAVGENYEIEVGFGPLVERWNGGEWSLVTAPLPPEAIGNSLNGQHEVRLHGVSCVSATFCALVGQFTKSWNTGSPNEIGTLVETWDGTSWTVQPSPNPATGPQNLLWGVSCVSAVFCVAVGESRRAGGAIAALVETWNGSKWSIASSPSLSGGLAGVSCSAESACLAVGGTQGSLGGAGGIAEVWNGSGWTTAPPEHPLRGVSCLAPASCIAVGRDLDSHRSYAEHWDGSAWRSDSLSRPTDASDEPMEMFGVSCVSSSCSAVGWYYSWGYAPLAEARTPPSVAPPAVPEYGRCAKVASGSGEYEDARCTRPGGTKTHDWSAGVVKAHFTVKLKEGAVTFETPKGAKVICKGADGAGQYTAGSQVAAALTFTECEGPGGQCASSGASAGEVSTNQLEGDLGIEKLGSTASADKIGLDLFSTGKAGPVMEFTCGTTPVVVRGSVIAKATAFKMLSSGTLILSAGKGKQKPEKFLNEPNDVLEASFNGGPYEQFGLSAKLTQTDEEPLEINIVT